MYSTFFEVTYNARYPAINKTKKKSIKNINSGEKKLKT